MLAWLSSLVALVLSALHFVRLRTPWGFALWLPKILAESLAPFVGLLGLLGLVLGVVRRRPLAGISGGLAAWLAGRYVWGIVTPRSDLDRAFGPGWCERIPTAQERAMLHGRWTWLLRRAPAPRWQRDVPFWTIPDSGRQLLCDVWQPPPGVPPSGLTVLYLHGSAWYLSDKDVGTRPLFRHLAGQGHLIVDVAYRLCPEVDMLNMVGDVRRAVAWVKDNAARYGVDPDCIVLGGASAGGHLALLAAYTAGNPDLTPPELQGRDLSVRAVFSYYGPTDLRALRQHNIAFRRVSMRDSGPCEPSAPAGRDTGPEWRHELAQMRRSQNMMAQLLGGPPDAVPHMWDLASPSHHVRPGLPPTMLIQGEHDMLVPASAVRDLYRDLLAVGVPAVYLELPQTDHAFDLFFLRISPPAQVALYELERFLSLVMVPETEATIHE